MNTQPPIRPQSLSRSDTPHIFGKHNLGALARLANDFSLITVCLVLASRGFAFFEVWSHAVLDSGGSALALLNKRYADSSHGKPSLLPPAMRRWRPRSCATPQCTSTTQTSLRLAAPRSSPTLPRHLTASAWAYFRTAFSANHPWIYNETERSSRRSISHSRTCSLEQGRYGQGDGRSSML